MNDFYEIQKITLFSHDSSVTAILKTLLKVSAVAYQVSQKISMIDEICKE